MFAKTNFKGNKLIVNIPLELESQFVLRLPAEPAQELTKALRSNSNIEKRLTLRVDDNMRHAAVRFDSWKFAAKFEDLPCVCESLKTIDQKTFYKVADVSQILCCTHDSDDTSDEKSSPDKSETETYLHAHGLTKPLKNVRKRRFRKTLKKKGGANDVSDTEKEVQRLLRVDNDAVNVRWEVMVDEDPVGSVRDDNGKASPTELDIFGEVSSSDDDEEINIIDSSDEDEEEEGVLLTGSGLPEVEEAESVEMAELEDGGDVLVKQRREIRQQIVNVQAKKKTHESVVKSVRNQDLKRRFLDDISELVAMENDLKIQYEKFE